MKKVFILFLIIAAIILSIILSCDTKPTEPQRANPFDPNNSETGGDPFQLTAKIAGGGITLEWNIPNFDALKLFKIYRSDTEKTGYTQLAEVVADKREYIDKAIENGHSYWYRVTVVNNDNKETNITNAAGVNINTQPVLVINGEDEYTAVREVTLTILAAMAKQMMLANDANFTGSTWENYATSKNWTLSTGEGPKNVFMKVKYDSTESDVVNAIILPREVTNITFSISDSDTSNTLDVALNIHAEYAKKMMISNDSSFAEAIWEDYSETKAWHLNYSKMEDSKVKVYIKFKNDFDMETSVINENIALSIVSGIKINNDEAYTSTRTVTLNIFSENANQMMISENSDFSDADWEDYAEIKNWTLPIGSGSFTVYAKFKNSSGLVSQNYSDDILPQPMNPTISLAGGAQYTNISNIQLLLSATGANLQMKLSEDSTFTSIDWQTYSANAAFQLSSGDGEENVFALFQNDFEILSDIINDNIILDTTPPTITLTVSPDSGIAGDTNFQFDPTGSSDNLTLTDDLQMRFDWENDGSFDINWQQLATTTHQFISVGSYTIKIQIKDESGLTSEDSLTVKVAVNPSNTGTVTDIDDNVYQTVKIGEQWWMAENLKVTKYRNGDDIPNETVNTTWAGLRTGAYCAYGNNSSNMDTYGSLYNWYAVEDGRDIAPEGWHVPTDEEWKELEMHLGMSQADADATSGRGTNEGDKLKSTNGWVNSGNGTNETGFAGLPGAYRANTDGTFNHLTYSAYFWSTTEYNNDTAWPRRLNYNFSSITRNERDKQSGFSVRCIMGEVRPAQPTLLSPDNAAIDQPTNPTLAWNTSNRADSYTLQVSISSDFGSLVYNADMGDVTSKQISGLDNSTQYFWRVKATNSYGNSIWSDVWDFTTESAGLETGTVTDIDGNTYQTIKIGNQWWMAENLKVTKYRNGDYIPNETDNTTWAGLSAGAYCAYDNNIGNIDIYGLLYNWYSVEDSRNISPTGWHVPTDEEWKELEMFLGMSQADADIYGWRGSPVGSKLKATSGWNSDGNGTNESGFSARPGGYRSYDNGTFSYVGDQGYWWSATESGSGAWNRGLHYDNSDIGRGYDGGGKRYGFSVRCIMGEVRPAQPTLLSPDNGAIDQATNPTLTWNASYRADSYTLQVSISSNFSSFIYNADVGDVTSQQVSSLDNSTEYFWRVKAVNSYGSSMWSEVWDFTTGDPSSQPELIAYYPFNGNVNDESGNGYHGSLLGAATVDGQLVTGNNSSDALQVPGNVLNGINDFSVTALLKINDLHPSNANFWITGTRNGELSAFGSHYNSIDNVFVININYTPVLFSANNALNDNGWHHVVISRQNSIARLFIDGEEVGSGVTVPNTTLGIDPTGLIVGQEQDAVGGGFQATQSWAGEVDNLRFYNYALSELEISSIYDEDGPTTGTVTDIDGNTYQTVKIGDQWWMAENLKVTQYRNSEAIPNITNSTTWSELSTGAYCAYDNNNSNIDTSGLLYNWYAVDDGRNIAPEGWHTPSDEEWKELEMYLGMSQLSADSFGWRGTDEGGKMKESGTIHWDSPNTGATNESGLTVLPGGHRYKVGNYHGLTFAAYFWTTTAYGSNALQHRMNSSSSQIGHDHSYRQDGFNVRLVKD